MPPRQKGAPPPRSKQLPVVYVEWEDAHRVDDGVWVFRKGAGVAKPVVFKQIGFLYSADETALVLTEAYSADQMAPRTRIPAGMVRRYVELDIPGVDAGKHQGNQ